MKCCVRAGLRFFACLAVTPASAQDAVADFFRGKQITIYVGSSAGGGYDTYARLISRYFGNHIPGNPTIVVENMPGAGSNKATGYVYSVAPKDGTAMAAVFPGALLDPLIGDVNVQHDPNKLIYVGNANSDVYICFLRSDAPAKTFQDTFSHEVILGASNAGGTTRDLPAMMNNLLGTKFRVVTGYAGSKEITLAIERNEVNGACGIGWTGLPTMHPDWFAKKLMNVIVQVDIKGHPDLNKIGRAAGDAIRQVRRGSAGDGADRKPGRVRPALCHAAGRAGRAGGGAAQGVRRDVQRPGAAGGGRQDAARPGLHVRRRPASLGGKALCAPAQYRSARQSGPDLLAAEIKNRPQEPLLPVLSALPSHGRATLS